MLGALQVIGTSPQIGAGYNVAPLFSYLMKTQGARLTEFEKSPEQMAFEQAMTQWQQVAVTVAEKGGDLKSIPPQPKPEEFGYNPGGSTKDIEREAERGQQTPPQQIPPQPQR